MSRHYATRSLSTHAGASQTPLVDARRHSMVRPSYESLSSEYSVATQYAIDRLVRTSINSPPVPAMPAGYKAMSRDGAFTSASFTSPVRFLPRTALIAADWEQAVIDPYHTTAAGAFANTPKYAKPLPRLPSKHAPARPEGSDRVLPSGKDNPSLSDAKVKGPVLMPNEGHSSHNARQSPVARTGLFSRVSGKIKGLLRRRQSVSVPITISGPLTGSPQYDQQSRRSDGHSISNTIPIAEAQARRRKGAFTDLNPTWTRKADSLPNGQPQESTSSSYKARRLNREITFDDFVNFFDSDIEARHVTIAETKHMAGLIPAPVSGTDSSMRLPNGGLHSPMLQVQSEWPPRGTSRWPASETDDTMAGASLCAADVFDPIDDAVSDLQLSPSKAQSLNREIHRLHEQMCCHPTADGVYEDDELHPRTTLDTFRMGSHTSFVLTYRPDESTLECWHAHVDSPTLRKNTEPACKEEEDEASHF